MSASFCAAASFPAHSPAGAIGGACPVAKNSFCDGAGGGPAWRVGAGMPRPFAEGKAGRCGKKEAKASREEGRGRFLKTLLRAVLVRVSAEKNP